MDCSNVLPHDRKILKERLQEIIIEPHTFSKVNDVFIISAERCVEVAGRYIEKYKF